MQNPFQTRITFQGNMQTLLNIVCKDFHLGNIVTFKIIPFGYEDVNIAVTTEKGKYVIKIFASFRSKKDCERYVEIMKNAVHAGVSHPKLYTSSQRYLHEINIEKTTTWLCVMEFIEGKTFYSLKTSPSVEELKFIARQAAHINNLKLSPPPVYDSWAVVNFINEYEKMKQYINTEDNMLIAPVVESFRKLNLEMLPHCFVHGDIIRTNVLKGKDGRIYILDFSVSNFYPRIQELAVLFCDLFFNEKNPNTFKDWYELGLKEYQSVNQLTNDEIAILPLYTKAAHAMHIICPSYIKHAEKNNSEENEMWLNLGRKGLQFTTNFWR